jgi:MFS family permease
VGYLILANNPELGAWRWMYAVAIIPAALVTAARFYVVQSPHWLASKGQFQKAEEALGNLLKREPQYPQEIRIPRERKQQSREKWA